MLPQFGDDMMPAATSKRKSREKLTNEAENLLRTGRKNLETASHIFGLKLGTSSLRVPSKKIRAGNPKEAVRLLKSHSLALGELIEAWNLLDLAKSLKLELKTERASLLKCIDDFQRGNYSRVYSGAETCSARIQERMRKTIKATFIDGLRQKGKSMEGTAVDVRSLEELLEDADILLDTMDIDTALELVLEALWEMLAIQKELEERILRVLAHFSVDVSQSQVETSSSVVSLRRARALLKDRQLGKAISILMSVEAQRSRRFAGILTASIVATEKLMGLRAVPGDVRDDVLSYLAKCEKAVLMGRLGDALGWMRKAGSRAGRAESRLRIDVEETLPQLTGNLLELRKEGIQVEEIEDFIDMCKSEALRGNTWKAVRIMEKAQGLVDGVRTAHAGVSSQVARALRTLEQLDEAGRDTSVFRSEIESLQAHEDAEEALGSMELLSKKIIAAAEDASDDIARKVEEIEARVLEFDTECEESHKLKGAVSDVMSELRQGHLHKALEAQNLLEREFDSFTEASRDYTHNIGVLSEVVSKGRRAGIPIQSFKMTVPLNRTKSIAEANELAVEYAQKVEGEIMKLRSSAQSRIDIVGKLFEESPGLDLSDLTQEFKRAECCYEEGRYRDALETSFSVQEGVKQQQSLFASLAGEVSRMKDIIRNLPLSVGLLTHYEERLQEIASRGSYETRIDRLGSLEAEMLKQERELRERVESLCQTVANKIREAQGNGIAIDSVVRDYEAVNESLSDLPIDEAVETLSSMLDDLGERESAWSSAQKALLDYEEVFTLAQKAGLDVSEAEPVVKDVKDRGEYDGIDEEVGNVRRDLVRGLEQLREKATAELDAADDCLAGMPEEIPLLGATEAITDAHSLLEEGRFTEAIERARHARKDSAEAEELYHAYESVRERGKAVLSDARNVGLEHSELEEALVVSPSTETDYPAALESLQEIVSGFERDIEEICSRSLEEIQTAERNMEDLRKTKTSISDIVRELEDAKTSHESGEFRLSIEKSERANELITERLALMAEAEEAMKGLATVLERADDLGVPMHDLEQRMEALHEVEELPSRLDQIRELEKEARRNVGMARIEAKGLLETYVSLAESYPPVLPVYESLHGILDEAGSFLSEQKLGKAFDALRDAESEMDRIEEGRLNSLVEIEKNLHFLDDLQHSGTEVPDVSKKLIVLAGYQDFDRVIGMCSEISSELSSVKESRENELVETLRSLSKSLDEANEKHIDTTEVVPHLKRGTGELRNGDYLEAETSFRLAEEKISQATTLHQELLDVAHSVEDFFEEMDNAGLETEELRQDFDEYRQMLPYETAIDSCTKLRTECEESMAASETEARGLYGDLVTYVEQVESQGVFLHGTEDFIAEAWEMLDGGRYGDAIHHMKKTWHTVDESIDLFNRSKEAIASARHQIELASVCGTETQDLEQRLRIAEEGTDYEDAVRISNEVSYESSQRRTELESLVRSELEMAQESINRMIRDGMRMGDHVERMLSESMELLEAGKFSESKNLIREVGEKSEDLWNQYSEMLETIEEARNQVTKLDDLVGERAKERAHRLGTSLTGLESLSDYSAGKEAANEIELEATEVWRGFESSLVEGLEELRSKLEDLRRRDLDTGMTETHIDQASQKLKDAFLGEGLDLLDKAATEVGQMELLQRAQDAIASAQEALKEAEARGVQVDDLWKEIPSAETVTDFDAFSRKLDKLSELVEDRKEKLKLEIQEDLLACQKEIRSMKASGVLVDPLEGMVEDAERRLRDEECSEARDCIERYASEKEDVVRNHERFLGVLNEAKDKLDEAHTAGLDCTDLEEAIENVRTTEDYETAIESLESAISGSSSVIAKSKAKAKSALDDVRQFVEELEHEAVQDMDATVGKLSLAISNWNEGLFLESLRVAQEAREAGKAALRNHRALVESMTRAEHSLGDAQTCIEEMQSKAIVVHDVSELHNIAVACFEDGRFAEAEEKAREACELAKHVEKTYQDAMARLGMLQEDVGQAESKGLDVSGLMDGVTSLADGNDYAELRLEVDRTHESLQSLIGSKKEEMLRNLSSQGEAIESLLEEKVMSARPALDLLEEASRKVGEEFFTEALGLMEKAAKIGSRARKKRDERNGVLADVENLFSLVDKAGLRTDKFSKKLRHASQVEDDSKAISQLRKLKQMMDAKLSQRKEAVAKAIEEVRNMARELHLKIVDVSEIEVMVSTAQAKVDQHFLSDAEAVLRNAEDKIGDLTDMIVEKRRVVDEAERTLWEARKAGVDTGPLYVRLERSRLNSVLHESVSGIKQVTRTAKSRMKEQRQGAEVLLNTVEARMVELEEKGIINRDLERLSSSARRMTESLNFGEAIKLCDEAMALAEETETSFGKLRDHMARAQHTLGEALRSNVDVDDLVERLGRARSLDDYEQAFEIVHEIIGEAEGRFKQEGVQIISSFSDQKEILVDSLSSQEAIGVSEHPSKAPRMGVGGEIIHEETDTTPEESAVSKEDFERTLSGLERIIGLARTDGVPVGTAATKLEELNTSIDNPDLSGMVDELRMEIDDLRKKHLLEECSCGAHNPQSSRFCQVCGGVLLPDDIGPFLPVGISRICPECSRLYESDCGYCQVCGVELEEAAGAGDVEVILTDEEGGNSMKFFEFDERVLGRKDFMGWLPKEKADYISRKHFRLLRKGTKVYLEHLSDTNPTKVNDEFVPRGGTRELRRGDKIDIAEGALLLDVDILP